MRIVCLTLCVLTVTCAVSPVLMAQDRAAMSDSEDTQLAALAAQAPELGDFKGGDVLLVVTPLVLVIALVVILLLLL